MSKKKNEETVINEIETPNEEITEEIVQAVAEGIVQTAEEDNKKVEDVVDEIIEEAKENDGQYTGDLRGFKTYDEAVNYPNTPEFEKLDIGCKTEYKNWLKSIMKED